MTSKNYGPIWPCRLINHRSDVDRNVVRIERAAQQGDWKAAAWLLERFYGIPIREEDVRHDVVDELADRRAERRASAQ